MDPFEITILKVEQSRGDENILYAVRDWLNEHYADDVSMRFIVIPDTVHDVYFLAFKTASMEEADRFRTLAIDRFNSWWAEKHPKLAKTLAAQRQS